MRCLASRYRQLVKADGSHSSAMANDPRLHQSSRPCPHIAVGACVSVHRQTSHTPHSHLGPEVLAQGVWLLLLPPVNT